MNEIPEDKTKERMKMKEVLILEDKSEKGACQSGKGSASGCCDL